MAKFFIDNIVEFNEYDVDLKDNVIQKILDVRKNEIDSKRFFLDYLPISELSKYDFNDLNSLKKFRDACCTFMSPLEMMGGCNLREEMLEKDIRYAGIKLSDPSMKIAGQFDIRNGIVTYSPIFPFFYEERDLCKFANDTYFTPLTFEELIINQIDHSKKFYVHTGDYMKSADIIKHGKYILEKVTKNQMIEYATNPELGYNVLKKSRKHY